LTKIIDTGILRILAISGLIFVASITTDGQLLRLIIREMQPKDVGVYFARKTWDIKLIIHLLRITHGGIIDLLAPFIDWVNDAAAIMEFVRMPLYEHWQKGHLIPLRIFDIALEHGVDILHICNSNKDQWQTHLPIEIRHYLRRRRLALRILARGLFPLLGSDSPLLLLHDAYLAREVFRRLY
jgi:hypothetical protein